MEGNTERVAPGGFVCRPPALSQCNSLRICTAGTAAHARRTMTSLASPVLCQIIGTCRGPCVAPAPAHDIANQKTPELAVHPCRLMTMFVPASNRASPHHRPLDGACASSTVNPRNNAGPFRPVQVYLL
jgi:hypothetical protein